MPKVKYLDFRFQAKTGAMIKQANEIIAEYERQGYDLTLRQLYYQFVSRDLLRNTHAEYKRLGSVINDARLGGLIDWYAITDRTRNLRSLSHWSGPESIIDSCVNSYRVDLWDGQSTRVEVWIEKEALAGVFERVCSKWDVPFFSCRGYTSQSEMWVAAQRLIDIEGRGTRTVILHFGDHDPSGLDMTRDITDRLKMFRSDVTVERLALTWEQVQSYAPPPNPAKMTDVRADAYVAEFGDESWELDALEPAVLADLVEQRLKKIIDAARMEEQREKIKEGKQGLQRIARNWDQIQEWLCID